MDNSYEWTKAMLLDEINTAWSDLNAALDELTPEQLAGPADAAGWTVKDHLTHMAAWENSIVVLLQGHPRYEGLGIDEALYVNGSEDEINDAIFRRDAGLSPAEARTHLQDVHQQLLLLLDPLGDWELNQPMGYFLPDWTGEGGGPPVIARVHANTADHFRDHLGWIQTLAATT